jgi:hypothetical protein
MKKFGGAAAEGYGPVRQSLTTSDNSWGSNIPIEKNINNNVVHGKEAPSKGSRTTEDVTLAGGDGGGGGYGPRLSQFLRGQKRGGGVAAGLSKRTRSGDDTRRLFSDANQTQSTQIIDLLETHQSQMDDQKLQIVNLAVELKIIIEDQHERQETAADHPGQSEDADYEPDPGF